MHRHVLADDESCASNHRECRRLGENPRNGPYSAFVEFQIWRISNAATCRISPEEERKRKRRCSPTMRDSVASNNPLVATPRRYGGVIKERDKSRGTKKIRVNFSREALRISIRYRSDAPSRQLPNRRCGLVDFATGRKSVRGTEEREGRVREQKRRREGEKRTRVTGRYFL